MTRPTKIAYFMSIADVVSQRATCNRAHVGCVLVQGDHIIATGYNGSPPGMPHCDDIGHDMESGHCVRTLHAEENALIQCSFHGVSARDAICYCTTQPCLSCTKKLFAAGVRKVWFRDKYASMSEGDKLRLKEFCEYGLSLAHIDASGMILDCSPNACDYETNPNKYSSRVTNLY